jgi:spermidine synthase
MKSLDHQQQWFTEEQTSALRMSWRIKKTLHREQTPYQLLEVVETEQYGRMLVLDGMVMLTEEDEFAYHELLTHIAMNTHCQPRKVLIVGGGDGGLVREVLRYPQVEQVILVELDQAVIEASKQYFPQVASGFRDPRVQVVIDNGYSYVQSQKNQYDVIMIDSTEPVGAGTVLFQADFYQAVYHALAADGLMVAQTESPWVNRTLIRTVYRHIAEQFPITRLYYGAVPTYPSGLWTFTLGSKQVDPVTIDTAQLKEIPGTRYYHPSLFHSVFVLPRFIEELIDLSESSR